ncbi:MAG TPA: lysoplasmalogenase family protein [Desulfomonilia bacterium]
MYYLIPVLFAVVGIVIYWWARQQNDLSTVSVVQPVITILCIITALLSFTRPGTNRKLTVWLSAGLAIALLGDFLNLNMTDPFVVIRGLVIAIIAYMTYAVGLTVINGFHRQDLYVGAAALVIYAGVMSYLWPYLGNMRIPGMIYGLVLPFVVTRAVSTFFGNKISKTQATFLTIGTAMLYIGDVEFALHTYSKVVPILFGPFLYSGGQLLIALSASYGKKVCSALSD